MKNIIGFGIDSIEQKDVIEGSENSSWYFHAHVMYSTNSYRSNIIGIARL